MTARSIVLAAALPLLIASVVSAQTGPSIQLVPSVVAAGQRVTVYGTNFCGSSACSPVTITMNDKVLASDVSVGADGSFQFMFIAAQIPDEYRMTASQTGEGGSTLQASYGLSIVPADVPPGQTPPIETLPPTTPPAETPPAEASPPPSGETPAPTPTLALGTPAATPSPAPAATASRDSGSSTLPWIILGVCGAAALGVLLFFGVRRLIARR